MFRILNEIIQARMSSKRSGRLGTMQELGEQPRGAEGNGERSVILSTHNIADMEAISDYAVIIDSGKILEQGWTTELSEKYLIVTGDLPDYERVSKNAVYCEKNSVGFTALLLSENVNCLSGTDVSELPVTLSQLSVMLMKSAENPKGSDNNEQKL